MRKPLFKISHKTLRPKKAKRLTKLEDRERIPPPKKGKRK